MGLGWKIAALPIRYKLLLAYATALTLAMLAGYSAVYVQVKNTIITNIEKDLENSTLAISSMVRASARVSVRAYLRGLAEASREYAEAMYMAAQQGSLSEEQARSRTLAYLARQQIGPSGYIYILDKNGVVVSHPEQELVGQDFSNLDFIRKTIAGAGGYIEYEWKNPGESEERPKAVYVEHFAPWEWFISISAYRGEFTRLIEPRDFRQSVGALELGPGGIICVLDSQGRIIVGAEEKGLTHASSLASEELLQQMLSSKNGRIRHSLQTQGEQQSNQRLMLYRHIPEFDWIVASSVPVEEYRKPLKALQAIAYLSLGLSLALFMPLSFVIGSYITRPLKSLITTFEQGAKGDLTVRAATGPADELGLLAAYFNEFMTRLEAYGRALRESEERYRSAMESTPDPIVVYNMQGRVSYCNPAFTRVFGWTLQEVQGERLHFSPMDVEENTDSFLDVVRKQKSVHGFETARLTKDDERREVIMSGALYYTRADAPLGMVVSMQDVTARRQTEEALKKSEERHRHLLEQQVAERTAALERMNSELKAAKEAAELATAAKGEFLANVSHEIRTPLNGIIGATELALREEMSPKLSRYMEIVHASAESLLAIIEDILDFSRIEAGRMQLEEQQFSLADLLQDIRRMFASKARQKRIELLFHMDPQLPDAYKGDLLRLKQVFTNLIANAVKFTEAGGAVVVSGKPAAEDSQAQDDILVEFTVEDTGIGMAPEIQDRLFQPFTQGDTTTTRRYGGTGLGLSICKRLVELMRGEIALQSKPGKGSIFTFTVRLGRVQTAPVPRASDCLQGLRVLVVDDSAYSRIVAQSLLKALGVEPLLATTPLEALEILREEHNAPGRGVHCLLTDWLMPQMDGLALAKRAREMLGKDIPVLVFTAFSEDQELGDMAPGHVDGVLAKPFMLETLRTALEQACLGRKEPRSQVEVASHDVHEAPRGDELQGVRLLAVEDNPTSLEVLQAILEDAGALVSTAENGLQAWQKLHELGPAGCDAMLLDLQMPEIDGFELARMVRQSPDFSNLPLVAITAHAGREVAQTCQDAGLNDCVSKPFSRKQLLQALLAQLSREAKEQLETAETGASDRTQLPQDLAGLQEVDVMEVMERFGFQEEGLRRILRNFRKANLQTPELLRHKAQSDDLEALRHQAHSLKGAASSIGAKRVFEAAQALNDALNERTSPKELLHELVSTLELSLADLLQALEQLQIATEEPAPERRISTQELIAELSQLQEALDAAQPVAVRERLGALTVVFSNAKLLQVEALADEYEYQAASALVQEMLRELQD